MVSAPKRPATTRTMYERRAKIARKPLNGEKLSSSTKVESKQNSKNTKKTSKKKHLEKDLEFDNNKDNAVKNSSGEDVIDWSHIVKFKSKEAFPPSGLETPLSTSTYDPYAEEMPYDVVAAVTARISGWQRRTDSDELHKKRVFWYGEDIANTYPGGETPKFARWLRAREEDTDSEEVV